LKGVCIIIFSSIITNIHFFEYSFNNNNKNKKNTQ